VGVVVSYLLRFGLELVKRGMCVGRPTQMCGREERENGQRVTPPIVGGLVFVVVVVLLLLLIVFPFILFGLLAAIVISRIHESRRGTNALEIIFGRIVIVFGKIGRGDSSRS
jgi:hypothetical protein